jgi:hypothetical protein
MVSAPPDGAGYAGEELGFGTAGVGNEARQLGRGHAGLGVETAVVLAAHFLQRTVGEDCRAVVAAVAHQQVAAQADQQQRLVVAQPAEESREVVEVGREIRARHRTAGAPGHMRRHGFIAAQ